MVILDKFKRYFKLKELFSQPVCEKYGEQAWSFLDPRLMHVLVWLREGINKPITINTDNMQQRGYRENTCNYVVNKTMKGQMYCSPHTNGKGVDLNVAGMDSEDVRDWMRKHKFSLPYPIRIETKENGKPITWVHVDVMTMSDELITEFEA